MGGLGCDNMTVILVCFLHGKSYEDLAIKCSKNKLDSNSRPIREDFNENESNDELDIT